MYVYNMTNMRIPGRKRHSRVLEDLFGSGTRLKYDKGEVIIRQDEVPQGVFLIERGYVKSYDITKYGEENLLVMRGPSQMFPILWTMTNERTDVFYEAMNEVELLRIDRDRYLHDVENDPQLSQAILKQVLEMYRIHSQRILNLEYRSAAERIAFLLINLADRFGATSNKGVVIQAPLRHQDIASSTNCSRETASRELSKLEKKHYITSSNGQITVLDLENLRKIVLND